jgi:hypothetical protein
MIANAAKTTRVRQHILNRGDFRMLKIEAKSEQEPPLIGELQVSERFQGVKGTAIKKILNFEEGKTAFVGEFPAQSQVQYDKRIISLVPGDIPVLLD